MSEARKRYPFRAEPPRIGLYRGVPPRGKTQCTKMADTQNLKLSLLLHILPTFTLPRTVNYTRVVKPT